MNRIVPGIQFSIEWPLAVRNGFRRGRLWPEGFSAQMNFSFEGSESAAFAAACDTFGFDGEKVPIVEL